MPEPKTISEINTKQSSIVFITLLRGLAVFLVVWDHLVGSWTTNNKVNWEPLNFVRQHLTQPLGIIQDGGFLGVVLFFIISGFIITHVAQRETLFGFALKRFFRIYPPYILSLIIILLVNNLYTGITGIKPLGQRTLGDFLWASTLLNLVKVQQNQINGVAWTLIIEVIFYLFCAVFLYFIKNRPNMAVICLVGVSLIIVLTAKNFGPNYFLFSISASYIPFLITGQILYYLWAKRLKLWNYLLLTIATYGVIAYSFEKLQPSFMQATNSYPTSFLYAYAIFVIALLLNSQLKLPRVLDFYAKISYSVYLYHGGIGLLLLSLLVAYLRLDFTLSLLFTLAVVTLVSYLSWRFIELPSQNLARYILKRQIRLFRKGTRPHQQGAPKLSEDKVEINQLEGSEQVEVGQAPS